MKEAVHQTAIFRWSRDENVRKRFPELALLHHVKNEEKGGVRAVAIDRAMGVKPGVPDICLPVPRNGKHGLYIELKSEGGRTSAAQDWWGERLQDQGYAWYVAHGAQEAVDIISRYLIGRDKV